MPLRARYPCCGVSLVQLSAWLSPLGGAEYAEDLSIAGEVVDRHRHLGRTPPCRHRRRQGLCSSLDVQPVPLVEAQRWGGHVGSIHTAGDLTAGE